jgi:hypothetical protein
MTVFAFEFFYFVKDIRVSAILLCFMAFDAGYIFVFAVEGKESFIVVEFSGRFEKHQVVAAAAVGLTLCFKLFHVNVCVAAIALCG